MSKRTAHAATHAPSCTGKAFDGRPVRERGAVGDSGSGLPASTSYGRGVSGYSEILRDQIEVVVRDEGLARRRATAAGGRAGLRLPSHRLRARTEATQRR